MRQYRDMFAAVVCGSASLTASINAQNCDGVTILSVSRQNSVQVGTVSDSASHSADGYWFNRTSESLFNPFNPLLRSAGSTDQALDIHAFGLSGYMTATAESTFHNVTTVSTFDVEFEVPVLYDSSYNASPYVYCDSALESAAGDLGVAVYSPAIRMHLWATLESTVVDGEIFDTSGGDTPVTSIRIWHLDEGEELFLESSFFSTGTTTNNVHRSDELAPGRYLLQLSCSVQAIGPSVIGGTGNHGDSSLLVSLDFSEIGPGTSRQVVVTDLSRDVEAISAGGSLDSDSLTDRCDTSALSASDSSLIGSSKAEIEMEARTGGLFGNITANAKRIKGSNTSASRADAEATASIIVYDDCDVEIYASGWYPVLGFKFARKCSGTLEIINSSGSTVWSESMSPETYVDFRSLGPFTQMSGTVSLSPGTYEVVISAMAQAKNWPISRSPIKAEGHMAFALLFNEP